MSRSRHQSAHPVQTVFPLILETTPQFSNDSIGKENSITEMIKADNQARNYLDIEKVFDLDYDISTDVETYPCWLICDVLLKGYLYITSQHLCFYATLPTKEDALVKTGFLKRYYKNNKKQAVTCQSSLKDDVLIFYHSNSAIYITGGIQMKEVVKIEPSKKTHNGFKIILQHKTFRFIADSSFSCESWIKILKASAYKAQNEGNEVLIKLPLENIFTIEMSFNAVKSETMKFKAFDEDPNIFEEYFFTYFTDASSAFDTIKSHINDRKKKFYSNRQSIDMWKDSSSAEVAPTVSGTTLHNSPSKKSMRALYLSQSNANASDTEDSLDIPIIKHHEWVQKKSALSSTDFLQEIRSDFALSKKEVYIKYFDAYMFKTIPRGGRIYVFEDVICFKSTLIGIKTKMLLKMNNIASVKSEKGSSFIPYRVTITTKECDEVQLDFYKKQDSVDFARIINSSRNSIRLEKKPVFALERQLTTDSAPDHSKMTFNIDELIKLPLPLESDGLSPTLPKAMHITCLTIGTRGDVQPYIALCKGLQKHGHQCRIGTHLEYKEWIESHGIEFREVKGDPAALMQLCVENGMFTYSFIREAKSKFKDWIDELLGSCWEACQGTELIIEAPTAMAGVHIAETLNVPYFGSFTMPWTRTKYYPHPFAVSDSHLGPGYNYMTHLLMEQIFWIGVGPQVNRWRKNTLNRPPIQLGSLNDHKIPYLYSFSPTVVPHPPDWQDWIHTCGYWFLDNPDTTWTPPQDLVDFIKNGSKPVYIGFGSIVVNDPEGMTDIIIEAIVASGVRAILSKGWSGRSAKDGGEGKGPVKAREYPSCIYPIDKIPHDWLFPQVAGVVHHGGAGTVAAGLRAGVPCIIKPFFGDQYFWADRVQELGVGFALKKFNVPKLTKLLKELTSNVKLQEKADRMGVAIRAENGVETAIECIYQDMALSKKRIIDLGKLSIEKQTSMTLPTTKSVQSLKTQPLSILKRVWHSINPLSVT